MAMLYLDDGTHQVSWGGETITLLPKEYLLFRFLYLHRNQAFRREELLDRVWGLEMPTDRTVDDHVYRLRKKLQSWQHLLSIETVRGVGYRLHWKEPQPANVLDVHPEFASHIKQMLEMYHGLGMGAALQTLSAHKDVLGFTLDPFYAVYVRFVTGEFAWFLRAAEIPLRERLFYLSHLYILTEKDPAKALALCKQVLSRKEDLPGMWEVELEMNLIPLYVETGQWQHAESQIEKLAETISGLRSNRYTLTYWFQQMTYLLRRKELALAQKKLEEAKCLLAEKPMQREQGMLLGLEGMLAFQRGEQARARRLIDEGIDILRQTRFVPHYLYAVRKVERFFQIYPGDSAWQQKYRKEWARLWEEHRLGELHKQLEELFARQL